MVLYFGFVMKIVLKTRLCFSCCKVVLALSQGLLCFSYSPASEGLAGHKEPEGDSQDSWPQLTKGMSNTIWHHAQYLKLGKKGGREDILQSGMSSQVTIMHDGALLSWKWLKSTCQWEAVNEFLISISLHMYLLLHLLNSLYLNFCVFSLLPFLFFPPSHWERSEWATVWTDFYFCVYLALAP